MERVKHLPNAIFCPKCGTPVPLVEAKDPITLNALNEKGYTECANGVCNCGAVLTMVFQPLPKSPTFTVMFDIYQKEVKEVA